MNDMGTSETVDDSQPQHEAKNVATEADVANPGETAQPAAGSLPDESAPLPTSEPPKGSPSSEPTSPPSPEQGDDEDWEGFRPRGKVTHTATATKGGTKR